MSNVSNLTQKVESENVLAWRANQGNLWTSVTVGSRLYNLHNENSDHDVRGFYVAPTSLVLSLYPVAEQLEAPEGDSVWWEVSKYVKLLLENNPNVLETLFAPLQHLSVWQFGNDQVLELVKDLYANKHRFLSQRVVATFGGYATAQFQKGFRSLGYNVVGGKVDLTQRDEMKVAAVTAEDRKHAWKNLMHLLRLLYSATNVMTTYTLHPEMEGAQRELLLRVRAQEVSVEELMELYVEAEIKFNEAKGRGMMLQEKPDAAWANNWLLSVRRVSKF